MILSPRDSVPSAWAGTLLTGSLIIAAIVQKIQGKISLHHATLILKYVQKNLLCLCSLLSDVSSFATLSCISSLAVAPMLPIWKLRARDYYRREIARHTLTYGSDDDDHAHALETQFYLNMRKKKIRDAQNRGRVILSLALLIQVCTTRQTKPFVPF